MKYHLNKNILIDNNENSGQVIEENDIYFEKVIHSVYTDIKSKMSTQTTATEISEPISYTYDYRKSVAKAFDEFF